MSSAANIDHKLDEKCLSSAQLSSRTSSLDSSYNIDIEIGRRNGGVGGHGIGGSDHQLTDIVGDGGGGGGLDTDVDDYHDPHYQDSIQPSLNFSRLAYNLTQFNETYDVIRGGRKRGRSDAAGSGGGGRGGGGPTRSRMMAAVRPQCTPHHLKRTMRSLLPITDWLYNYNWKSDLVADIVTGVTIAIFQVPQSMGYSLLAQVSPIYGLYSSFFPALIYSFMGSSRHASIGTFAIVSLMTGSIINEMNASNDNPLVMTAAAAAINETIIGSTATTTAASIGGQRLYSNIEMASMIALLIGAYQLLFGIFRMGFISVYMSEQLISSFITASSFYVLTSQIGYMSGLHLTSHSGTLSLFKTYADFFGHIHQANTIALSVSFICIAILLFFKLYFIDKLKQWTKMNIPFPIELTIVVGSTLLSSLCQLNIDTVGPIDTGLPSPLQPRWSLIPKLWLRCIPLAIVAYAITYSTGKTFATKHNYEISSNQELLAIGTTNVFSSFFSCLPTAASLSRSAVQETVGGKTQMASIVNSVGILFVLLYFGQYLEKLPNCVLASIICVALKTLFAQIFDVWRYCRVNKLDGSIWIVTFVAVIVLNVDIGLYVGLAYSLVTLIYKSQRPKTYLLGSIDKSDVYVPLKKYGSAHELTGIKIYQFCGPLHFANVEYFKRGLQYRTKIYVNHVIERRRKLQKAHNRRLKDEEQEAAETETTSKSAAMICGGKFQRMRTFSRDTPTTQLSLDIVATADDLPTHLIIDCSMFSYIDTTGVTTLKTTVQEYESIGVKTFLANCAAHVVKMLEKDGFYDEVKPYHVYITIHDAVHHALEEQKGVGGGGGQQLSGTGDSDDRMIKQQMPTDDDNDDDEEVAVMIPINNYQSLDIGFPLNNNNPN
ncbi:solute carrier family 26 member 6-like isoform X2 [Oppia nitens]|uniref:solute carrier family 26 member 6-like isoform X2 n=1 Tax=Oppia nitens TaxID=1686743 RepID=UPI0023DAC922|nr:solute carrier family 26 member 6-like isoform X2 [Oppia nitens]